MGSTRDVAAEKLRAYSATRLLGEHVPYPVEAFPEGNQAHLAAEGALYCRILTEGVFGFRPLGFRELECTPNLPLVWNEVSLSEIYAFGQKFSLHVRREGTGQIRLIVSREGKEIFSEAADNGSAFKIRF